MSGRNLAAGITWHAEISELKSTAPVVRPRGPQKLGVEIQAHAVEAA